MVFITGLSGISVKFGNIQVDRHDAGLRSKVIALSLVFYILDKLKLTNDREEA